MRSQLEQDVLDKRQSLAEAEERLSSFRANTLSAIGAASGSKSAQKKRAERQAVVANMLAAGLTRAEIVRRTGINDHLVGYDIDCLRKHRVKQGTKKVMRTDPKIASAPALQTDPIPPTTLKIETAAPSPAPASAPEPAPAPASAPTQLPTTPKKDVPPRSERSPVTKLSPSPFVGSPSEPLNKAGQIRPGCSVSRDQLKAAMKSHQRGERDTATFVTTVDSDHAHTTSLDRQGDGETVRDDTGHFHRVCHYELIEGSHNHTHGLTLEEGIEE